MAHDVRAIANFVLDSAALRNIGLTNIDVNKIVYFLHGWYLAKYRKPLVSAKIEAWPYGPVFRELYAEFKQFKDKPITSRASRINPLDMQREICVYQFDVEELTFLGGLVNRYIKMPTHVLMSLSHKKNGPWDKVWNAGEPGMQISDELIWEYFRGETRN